MKATIDITEELIKVLNDTENLYKEHAELCGEFYTIQIFWKECAIDDWQNDITLIDKCDVVIHAWKYLQKCNRTVIRQLGAKGDLSDSRIPLDVTWDLDEVESKVDILIFE